MDKQSLRYAIGVDLGGTKIGLGVVDEEGRILQHQRLETRTVEGAAAVEEQIIEGVRKLQQEVDLPILGVGVGAAGQIHKTTGEVIFAPNLKWHNVPLQHNLEEALRVPVRVLNDVKAITWGEWQFGAGKGCQDLICIFIGTGIGSGIVSGDHFMIGCNNTFGEVGHMTVDLNGPLCTCGKLGCLEAFAAGWGIAARAREAIEEKEKGLSNELLLKLAEHRLNDITAKIVVQAYHQGDPTAKLIIERAERALIAGIASLINILNPCRIILGGGVIDGMPEMIDVIDEGVRQVALRAATQSLKIVKSERGKEVGVVGSAAVIFNQFKCNSLLERKGI
jgi:glucokinase